MVVGGVCSPMVAAATGTDAITTVDGDTERTGDTTNDAIGDTTDDTVAGTAPDATVAPSSTTPATTSPGGTEGDDDGVSTGALWIGVIAALGLLAAAVWWMLRQTDDQPPPSDPDWPRTTDVI